MKSYFYLGVGIIITLIVALLVYGVYMNQRGENEIAQRMENLQLPLTGTLVKQREIQPLVELDLVNLYCDDMTDIIAQENGRIVRVFVDKHGSITAGTPIVQLLDEDIPLKLKQAESDILDAEAQLVKTRNSYNRYKKLIEMDAVSAEKFDEAEAAYKAAQARLSRFEAERDRLQVRMSRQLVISSIEGEVLRLYHSEGAYVTAGTPVALVGDFSKLYFSAPVVDEQAQRMEIGRPIEVFISGGATSVLGGEALPKSYGANYSAGNKGADQIFSAKVIKITPDLSEPATVRQAVWQLDNRVGLLEPGAYRKMRLHSSISRKCLTVPIDAFTDENHDKVAVLEADGHLGFRHVQTGITDGTYMEIISGLSEGDIVITSDTEGLTSGTEIDITLEDN
ncbi:putative Co/Zn/Cd efflux system membrane fusion protein [Anaerovibrio sp. JC8]|uniref:efflux RND transporter periplasmic adaptor subunit n=1 Tax=Anaerovibrio sp. JC8 TaxID=1240085 RepID=UPI000A09677D|nr:efflux RND transporter periplasmic adaptor subunit [Anaerovibrio sp. JC8]ORU00691.1 putative Co/Zn/Cd efflux system membrane fusion protein [Anaerovibrio sp. JC8]